MEQKPLDVITVLDPKMKVKKVNAFVKLQNTHFGMTLKEFFIIAMQAQLIPNM